MPHNSGTEFDPEWLSRVEVNLPAVKRRAANLGNIRTVKGAHQAAWLLRAVTCCDLTTLSGDDSFSNVQRLCFKAKNPIHQDLIRGMSLVWVALKYCSAESWAERLSLCECHCVTLVQQISVNFPCYWNCFVMSKYRQQVVMSVWSNEGWRCLFEYVWVCLLLFGKKSNTLLSRVMTVSTMWY